MRIQAHQEIETITFPALCASTVSFRFATGLVLSFNVSDRDDSSHSFDAFGDVCPRGYLQYLDCQSGCPLQMWNTFVVVVVWANLCCGKETTIDDTDNIKLNRTDKSLMTSSTIFFPRLMWSFLPWCVLCGVRSEMF